MRIDFRSEAHFHFPLKATGDYSGGYMIGNVKPTLLPYGTCGFMCTLVLILTKPNTNEYNKNKS